MLIWLWSTHQTLVGDEWGYALRTATQPAHQYLLEPPPGKHLIAIPLLAYKAAFDVFGIDSYVPYRIGHIVLLLVCAVLFYALARRRIGDLLAVLPTTVLLFLGTSWEVVATPLRSPSLFAIAAGLGMLLVLERRDLRGDLAACALLAIGLASHSTALAFAGAALVLVLSRSTPERWKRIWVVALPLAAYAIWWVLAYDPGDTRSLGSTVVQLPAYLAKALGATLLATEGLLTHSEYGGIDIAGAPRAILALALVALLAGILIARVRRSRSITPFELALVVGLLVFWVATAFAPGPNRSPAESRYLYPDAVLFLLLLCELGRDFRLPSSLTRRVLVVIAALFAISIVGNLYELRVQERAIDNASDRIRAAFTSLALGSPPPRFNLATTLAGRFPASDLTPDLAPSALDTIFAKYGSPAYSPAELASRPQPVRVIADYVSLQLAGGELQPAGSPHSATAPAPREVGVFGGRWAATSRGCIALRPTAARAAGVLSPTGAGITLTAGAGPAVAVSVGRFADGVPVPVGSLGGGETATLRLPPSKGAPEWRIGVRTEQKVVACSA